MNHSNTDLGIAEIKHAAIRPRRLRAEGYIIGTMSILDRRKINLPTTVFVLVKTGRHIEDWIERFHAAVSTIPEVVEVHRLTGNYDYILKIVLPNVEYYDVIYKQIIRRIELYDMSAYISMETVKQSFALPTIHT
ncbi:Lrp/AsnC family transcriptional regulator [Rhizobium lemnae]|uniref:Lrp/AsnC family transcriptional regulator n=1 Tax=Rhizobium lemnae TaxID=1214924 RepID=A0ABV8EE21_9HYPH|nr:Lrp/AsnC family transcriptional regulator [Rhizobium lemnae]MCJ8509931.1 Lrp/AsnC family transcriptional regulator [Rhizobium lemnae]